jgi:hypothetical protein
MARREVPFNPVSRRELSDLGVCCGVLVRYSYSIWSYDLHLLGFNHLRWWTDGLMVAEQG